MSDHGGPYAGGYGGEAVSRRTQLIRAAADGELDAAAERELAEHLQRFPEDARVIAFERTLRSAVAQAWEEAAPIPERLRERMQADAAAGDVEPDVAAQRDGTRPRRTIGRSWFMPAAAAAAAAAIILGLFLFTMRPGGAGDDVWRAQRGTLVACHP